MADSTLAQDGALKVPHASKNWPVSKLGRRGSKGWTMARCWLRYLLGKADRSVPELVDFVVGNHFFRACQDTGELAALGEMLAKLRPERTLEIGTALGGTLFFLARLASPTATIVSVDLPGGKFGGGYGPRRRWFYQRFARRNQKLHLLQGDSHSPEMLRRVKTAFKGEPIDYLFIDGDHSYEGVKSDFEIYGSMVRRGGLIAFHDIGGAPVESAGEVPRFWQETKSNYRHVELIRERNRGWGIGVLFVE